ncbi:MAG: hypothetical protein II937_06940 [Bacteroidales bacterium]|nr:hypothetical protein [Bacteroidales bacterium]
MEQKNKYTTIFKSIGWDIVIMTILIINLILLVWDWFYSIAGVTEFFKNNTPSFNDFYNQIHQNIRFFDLIFVIIYITDFIIGWLISVVKKKESKFHYPFIHWYDLLGCIPSGALVFFRLFRVISIIIRLYKRKIIDIKKWLIVRKALTIYNIIMEEISDRVVLNILFGIKQNISAGTPVTKLVFTKIIEPQKQRIIDLIFNKIKNISEKEYNLHKDEILSYVKQKTKTAIENNKEVSRLSMIPVVGNQIKSVLEKSISQTVFSVTDNLVSDVLSASGQEKLKNISVEISDNLLKELELDLQPVITDIIYAVVDIIAQTANVKQWKLEEIRSEILKAKNAAKPDEELIQRLENRYNNLLLKSMEIDWDKELKSPK